jgi:peptidoglycan hydrolase-like amidase
MFSCPKKITTKNKILLLISLLFLPFSIFFKPTPTYAKDECKDISNKKKQLECYAKKEAETRQKLENTRSKINDTLNILNQIQGQLSVNQTQLNQVQNNINETKDELEEINKNLVDRYQKLKDKISFRNSLLRNYSKKNILTDLEILFSQNRSGLTGLQLKSFLYAFNKATSEEVLNIIGMLNSEIGEFENNKREAENIKNELEKAQESLIAIKNDLAIKKVSEEEERKELEEKETGYEAELAALQSKILALKYSEEGGTVGDYEGGGGKTPNPPFGGKAFAAFSFGAYTHYNGMSQYGAKGRADEGQDYKKIIKFYYGEDVKEKDDFPSKICVEGHGEMSYQKYLYGIAEMPSSWNSEALKAQAIAARSYAYRRTKNGGCICTTQSCQVFSKSKSDNPPSSWKKAVDDTKNKIIGGDTNKTGYGWYSSTTGGYVNIGGWDSKDGFKGWQNGKAYEKSSPWFYKAWYTKSYNNSSSCNHPHPWLTEKEMADILNSYVVYTKGSSSEKGHITPRSDCWGGDPYSLDKMAEKAEKYGSKYTSVSDVDVEISSGGYTSKITFNTNKGSVSFDGPTFKTVFNLRAPGYLAIRSKLFDIKTKN